MLQNAKRLYRLTEFKVERRPKGWFFTRAAYHNDKEGWRGPYSSMASVRLMIARELKREIARPDAPYAVGT